MPGFHRVVRAIAAIALAGACVDASADPVIGAVGITSDHGDYDTVHNSYPLVNIINPSALSRTYVSGVTDFDSYVTETTGTVDNSNAGVGYTGSPSKGPVVFTFDLGAVYRISGVAIWNKYPNYSNSQQIGDFELYADADGDPGDGLDALLTSDTLNGDPSPAKSKASPRSRHATSNSTPWTSTRAGRATSASTKWCSTARWRHRPLPFRNPAACR